jgi:hypothetical protein
LRKRLNSGFSNATSGTTTQYKIAQCHAVIHSIRINDKGTWLVKILGIKPIFALADLFLVAEKEVCVEGSIVEVSWTREEDVKRVSEIAMAPTSPGGVESEVSAMVTIRGYNLRGFVLWSPKEGRREGNKRKEGGL